MADFGYVLTKSKNICESKATHIEDESKCFTTFNVNETHWKNCKDCHIHSHMI